MKSYSHESNTSHFDIVFFGNSLDNLISFIKVVAIISSKVTLRERVAQTGYWNFKLKECPNTKHINVLFVTLDEDGTLATKNPSKKGRAIAEVDIDGTYVLTMADLVTSDKVKLFDSLIKDLKKYIE